VCQLPLFIMKKHTTTKNTKKKQITLHQQLIDLEAHYAANYDNLVDLHNLYMADTNNPDYDAAPLEMFALGVIKKNTGDKFWCIPVLFNFMKMNWLEIEETYLKEDPDLVNAIPTALFSFAITLYHVHRNQFGTKNFYEMYKPI